MALKREPPESSLIDVLDRILDKGIVVDAWVRITQAGIDLSTDQRRRIQVQSSDSEFDQLLQAAAPFDSQLRHEAENRFGNSSDPRDQVSDLAAARQLLGSEMVRFTDGARRGLAFAHEEAKRLGHHAVGTEHLLIGLLRERESAAAITL